MSRNKMAVEKTEITKAKDKLLPRMSLFFFARPRIMALAWITIIVFGLLSYTTFMRREGFPTINIPYSLVNGTYLVGDPAKVDNDIAKPLSQIITKQPDVKTVDAQSGKDFYTISIQYKDGTDAKIASAEIEKAVKAANVLPKNATAEFKPLSPGIDLAGHDMLISYYSRDNGASTEQMYDKAVQAVNYLKQGNKIPFGRQYRSCRPFCSRSGSSNRSKVSRHKH